MGIEPEAVCQLRIQKWWRLPGRSPCDDAFPISTNTVIVGGMRRPAVFRCDPLACAGLENRLSLIASSMGSPVHVESRIARFSAETGYMDKALSNIRVIDMTHNQAGPAWL